jgi:hypothetical protein
MESPQHHNAVMADLRPCRWADNHFSDMALDLGEVRYWTNSGKHLLTVSFSGFDPKLDLYCRVRGGRLSYS